MSGSLYVSRHSKFVFGKQDDPLYMKHRLGYLLIIKLFQSNLNNHYTLDKLSILEVSLTFIESITVYNN